MGASRRAIVSAALACAVEGSWEATSLQVVRQRAGVSNGTLFHHFPTRQRLETAVVEAGLAEHQDALLCELRAALSTCDGVVGVVLRHLRWVQDNPELARLLLSVSPQALHADLGDSALAASRSFFAEVADWLRGQGWRGRPELAVLTALWIGPAQDYARGWVAGPRHPMDPAAPVLADGAWQALRPLLEEKPR